MSRNYAVKERDGTIHDEPSRKEALRSQKAFGGMVVQTKSDDGTGWKTYKRHRVFLWIFLAVQVGFIIWVSTASTASTGPTAAEIARFCGHGGWQSVFSSYADCVKHGAVGLADAANLGKGIAVSVIVIAWVVVDFLLAVTYGIYRLAKR
jgi:hypothetical protein